MPSENHAIFRQMYERFRFSINRDDYADLMQRIKEGNNYLKRLTSQNLRLEPARTSQHTWTPQRFDLIRGYASSLVSALRSGFCCSCQAPHSINLMLESRYEKPYQKFEQIDEQITFSVTFGYGYRNNISNSVPWLWKRASIQLAHVEEVATTETATSTAKLEISNSLVSNDRLSRKPKKLARFSITEVNEDHSSCNVTPPRPPGVELISDLCTSIVQKSLEKNSLDRPVGYLFDKSRACKYVVHPLDSASISSFSLRQAMLESVPGQFAPMRMSARKTLAMTLASSVLQLYGTPWLPAKWKSDDILFIHAQDLRPHLAPHVSTLVTPEMTEAPSKSPATSPKKGFMSPNIRDEVTFGLGILLIELCLGKPIDQLRTPSDLNPDGSEHVTTDFRTATRLLDDIYEEAGGRYGDAVRRCIYCEFDQRKTTLEDPLFRRAVYQGVVCPLEEDLAEFHCLS